ncbi:molybdopterin-dependent oxidoreductase [Tropicimonas isoalkanivorans]|uniref:Biotin/methionine sulfoxide reductase n=1 Tax=Tropicimonas isoalkanivorans TaxID=441112 RepID=A0A1I1KP25_9RHOB|nr:molybdopterin-dependent oxidoreductase [Tropicimonas isoalkanivorans]SFC62517.1 biotin/methionine sulfoxide reductase [Tropicimonas isoalkanivorans]
MTDASIPLNASHWGAFRAEVVDGSIARVLPFEHDPRPSRMNEAWEDMLTAPLRIAQPVVRKGWLKRDGGAARGDDTYVGIGWDDALDLAAAEIARVRADYGNSALFGGSYGWSSAGRVHHARTLVRRFFASIGGHVDQETNYSYGAAMAFLPRIVGNGMIGSSVTSLASIRAHCDIFLAFGGVPAKNWEIQSGGIGEHRYDSFMAGVTETTRTINISPYRKDVEDQFGVEWMPVRPCTDVALMMALTQEVVAMGRADLAFLTSHTAGADRYLAYLAGEVDGTPKTADWASGITGIPAEEIRALARDLPGKRIMVAANWSLQRARHGEQPYWAAIALASVLGQIGLPGGGFAFGYGSTNGMGNPNYRTPLQGLPSIRNPTGLSIPCARLSDLLLKPGESYRFNGATRTYPEIKLVYWAGGNPFHHHQDLNRLRDAFRQPETVIVNEQYWTATARHADIVFPTTVTLERDDIGGASRDRFLLAMQKLVEPYAGARDDYAIFADLAARLGPEEAATFTDGRSAEGWVDWAWGEIAGQLQSRGIDVPAYREFQARGYLEMPEPEDDFVMMSAFRADPVANPLSTPSGKIELYSDWIAEEPDQLGHPAWLDPEEWLGAAGAGERLHMLSPQPARKLHGQMDFSAYSLEGKVQNRECLRIGPEDAAARDIKTGDVLRVFNDRGACFAVAEVDDGLMPGVVLLPTGATYDPDGTCDRNSNPNVLTRDIGTSTLGQGCAAQSCLVDIERHDAALPPLKVATPSPIEPLKETR